MTLPVSEGQRLGNYRLHRLLGKGSFADVYLGEHLYLYTSAAIKILHRVLDEEEEQLFLTEAQTIARLAHPNIVRVREFAIERSIPFLVMDYAPGGTLRHLYPKGTCLSLEQTVTTIKQIAAALQYAHNHGLIHRDVKPENVLQGTEQVMLSDFGISITAPTPSASTSGVWPGTLPYMAPEQLQGQAVFASDQYALAVMAYEWLCGKRPFEGSAAALSYQHAQVPPPRLREQDPSLPEAVEAVIEKALSKQPQQRYVSILTFARALERASRTESGYTVSTGSDTEDPDTPYATFAWRVFLSHAPSDDITRLHEDLSLRNLAVQNEEASSSQGTDAPSQEERTRQAIRASQAVLLLLTPHTRAQASVHEHLRIARLYRRKILCLWQEGEALQDLLPQGAEQAMILDARGQRYSQALDEIILAIEQEHRGTHADATPFPELDFEPRNPYKGLLPFTRQDRADFFGRHTLVQALLAQLKEQLVGSASAREATTRFLAVVGPSGSGKSSAVMAGLLPALQDGALPDSAGTLTLLRTTIARNTVNSLLGEAAGGGIYADRALIANARFSLTNCTIANNQAQGAQGLGDGFSTDNQPISGKMDFCTIFGNVASTRAGGIDAADANAPLSALLTLKNSLVAGNTAKTDPDITGSFITGGYNLVQNWRGALVKDPLKLHRTDLSIKPSVQVGIVTKLLMNGGQTPTLALQAGSPAINAIPVAACDVSTDQRGVKRPQHSSCDIGSYEYS